MNINNNNYTNHDRSNKHNGNTNNLDNTNNNGMIIFITITILLEIVILTDNINYLLYEVL